jgi:hypothetical protein
MQWFMEFDQPTQFSPSTIKKASDLGIALGFVAPVMKNDWNEGCAVARNTFAIKDTLKAHGARWNGIVKVWTFNSYAALENAIAAIEEK